MMSAPGDVRCGRVAGMAGFAATMSTRRRQVEAGVVLRPATFGDCVFLGGRGRSYDAVGIEAMAGMTPLEHLIDRVHESARATTALDAAGEVICMFGVAPVGFICDAGQPWLAWSGELEKHRRLFIRLAQRQLMLLLDCYPWLTGHVDADRSDAIRFLEWLGFYVGVPTSPVGGRDAGAFNFRIS